MQPQSPIRSVAPAMDSGANFVARSLAILRHRPLAALALPLSTCAAFLAPASVVRADQITYSIVNYPLAETDTISGMQDSLSGTVTVISSGTVAGTYTASSTPANNLTMDFDITISSAPGSGQPSIEFTEDTDLGALLGSGSMTFSSSTMLLTNGFLAVSSMNIGSNVTNGQMSWRSDEGTFIGLVDVTVDGFNEGPKTDFDDETTTSTAVGLSPWTIATVVPEPSTLALFGAALLLTGCRRLRQPIL